MKNLKLALAVAVIAAFTSGTAAAKCNRNKSNQDGRHEITVAGKKVYQETELDRTWKNSAKTHAAK